MACNARDLMAVLTNLVPGVCHGDSCAWPGASSRVVALKFLLGRHPYVSSRVKLMEVPEFTAAGVAASRRLGFPQRWGWLRITRDGSTAAGMAAQG
jgi:hypothetical protein